MLYTDMRNILHNKGVKICLAACVAYLVGSVIFSIILLKIFDASLYADEIVKLYPSISIFAVTALTITVYISEYTDGIIKNKLCSGAKRSSIFFAAEMSSAFSSFCISAMIQIVMLLVAAIFSEGFNNMTAAEMAFSYTELLVASTSIAIFSTSLIMIMGGKGASYVIGLGIAFVFKIIDMEVLDKLYPDYGICKLTGTKLKVYTFYDRFVPYAHCSGTPRWNMSDCVIGSLVLVIISLIIGFIAFEKKEIK
jgi:ABC-type transport system involved in multi-copper enzyme maturation permease subunit